eukprot:g11820.t1
MAAVALDCVLELRRPAAKVQNRFSVTCGVRGTRQRRVLKLSGRPAAKVRHANFTQNPNRYGWPVMNRKLGSIEALSLAQQSVFLFQVLSKSWRFHCH